jgi:hypothetical protein
VAVNYHRMEMENDNLLYLIHLAVVLGIYSYYKSSSCTRHSYYTDHRPVSFAAVTFA